MKLNQLIWPISQWDKKFKSKCLSLGGQKYGSDLRGPHLILSILKINIDFSQERNHARKMEFTFQVLVGDLAQVLSDGSVF